MREFARLFKKETRFVKETYPELEETDIEVYVDCENIKRRKAIIKLIRRNKKKYREKLYYMLSSGYNQDHYKKVYGSITEIVFTKGKKNTRIYCKEFKNKGKRIVMILSAEKDFQKIKEQKDIDDFLKEANKSYQYNFHEED